MKVCQIAITCTDLDRTYAWYKDVFCLLNAGLRRRLGSPANPAEVLCLVDSQEFFQFEMFGFRSTHIPRKDWKPNDHGWSMLGIYVSDFDSAIRRIEHAGTRFLTPPIGVPGSRRVCLRDPENVIIEIMEDDFLVPCCTRRIRSGIPSRSQSITLSVTNLETAREFWVDTLGLTEVHFALHRQTHEALWHLEGAQRKTVLLLAGDFLIELSQYIDPVGRQPLSPYRYADQGILNVAIGFQTLPELELAYKRIDRAGYKADFKPRTMPGIATVAYVRDAEGCIVELLHVTKNGLKTMGFLPR